MEQKPPQPEARSRPWLAVLITVVVLGVAIWQQWTQGSVQELVLVFLFASVGFWSGRSFEGPEQLLRRWLGR